MVSTEIVDIMKAAGLESPDISILSDDSHLHIGRSANAKFEPDFEAKEFSAPGELS